MCECLTCELYLKGGEPSIDCAEKEECISNVTCTFDSGDCCYQFLDPDTSGKGSTPWVRHRASQIRQVDHTQNNRQGNATTIF
jgi:hypothetical protein